MSTTLVQPKAVSHPHILGWGLTSLSIISLAGHHNLRIPFNISREKASEVGSTVYAAIEEIAPRMVIGLDLRGISLMPSFLWRQLGPLLHNRALENALGVDKRVFYLTGGDEELLRNLRWAFLDASKEVSTRAGKLIDRAALVPKALGGYCGVLRQPYEEVLALVNQRGSITNEEVVEEVGRYTFNNANNYLTGLAELGLILRQVSPRPTGGYVSRAYSISVQEELIDNAINSI